MELLYRQAFTAAGTKFCLSHFLCTKHPVKRNLFTNKKIIDDAIIRIPSCLCRTVLLNDWWHASTLISWWQPNCSSEYCPNPIQWSPENIKHGSERLGKLLKGQQSIPVSFESSTISLFRYFILHYVRRNVYFTIGCHNVKLLEGAIKITFAEMTKII